MVILPMGLPIELRGEEYRIKELTVRALDYFLDVLFRTGGEDESDDAKLGRYMVLFGKTPLAVGSSGILRLLKVPDTIKIMREEAFEVCPEFELSGGESIDVLTAWLKHSRFADLIKKLVEAGEQMIIIRDVVMAGAPAIQPTSSLTPPSESSVEP
jgi:hypothetical protein